MPAVRSNNSGIGATFEHRRQIVAVLFAVGTPAGRILLEDAVIGKAVGKE